MGIDRTGTDRSGILVLSALAVFALGLILSVLTVIGGSMVISPIARQMQESLAAVLLPSVIVGAVAAGFVCDGTGPKPVLLFSAILQFVGTALAILSLSAANVPLFPIALTLLGLSAGLTGIAIVSLTALLRPAGKTTHLLILAAYGLGGALFGAMLAVVFCAVPGNHLPGPAYKFSDTHGWQLSLAVAVLPALCFGAALLRFRPPSLFGEAASRPELKGRRWHFWQPFVILWSCCFLLGGAVQGGTGNVIVGSYAWVSGMTPVVPLMILTCVMGLSCAVSCLLSRRYSPVALLCCSCLVLLIALVLMMREVKPAIDEFAFVLWAFGAGAIFPGLIGVAADRFPRGGARLLGVMTALYAFGAAVLSRATAAVYKHFETSAAAGLGWNIGDLREAYFEQVRGSGLTLANVSLEAVHRSMARPTLIAVVLCVIFGLVWLADKRRGGYHVERLDIDPLEVYAGVASDKPL